MRYYSTQRPVVPGSYPKPIGNTVKEVVNFDERTFCPTIGREAWGYIDYELPLSPVIARDMELVQDGMKRYWCVTTSCDDKGQVIAHITSIVESAEKPENSFTHTGHRDIYNDWFDSREEAEKFVEEAEKA